MLNQRPSSVHDPRYKCIINVLSKLRRKCGISQVQLAAEIGVTQPDISKIERLERRLDIIEFLDIQHALIGNNEERFTQFWKEVNECYRKHPSSRFDSTPSD